jgi:hypothetical protein
MSNDTIKNKQLYKRIQKKKITIKKIRINTFLRKERMNNFGLNG